jgi:hypothetical protein
MVFMSTADFGLGLVETPTERASLHRRITEVPEIALYAGIRPAFI